MPVRISLSGFLIADNCAGNERNLSGRVYVLQIRRIGGRAKGSGNSLLTTAILKETVMGNLNYLNKQYLQSLPSCR